MGSCLEQAPFCSLLARETGRLVLSVDYRKGPLDQFPAAIEDAEDVLAAVLDSDSRTEAGKMLRQEVTRLYSKRNAMVSSQVSLDQTRLSFSGFSSGGNLALNLALSISTPSVSWPSLVPPTGPAVPLLLFYPSFDSRLLPSQRPRPPNLPAPGRLALAFDFDTVLNPIYLPMDLRSHPRASPGLADMRNGLHSRARILLILSELDSLAEQSEVWIARVRDEERDDHLEVERAKGMPHGWTQFPETWLNEEEKRGKHRVFKRAVQFVREVG